MSSEPMHATSDAMTPRQRMLAAYRCERPDRVPVSPELWDAAILDIERRPFHELFGPYSREPFWRLLLKAHRFHDTDAWVLLGPGSPRPETTTRDEHRFIDESTIETVTVIETSRGTLRQVGRTSHSYAGWETERPVKEFPEDMVAYEEHCFADPWENDVTEVEQALEETGEQGLVTVAVGEPFLSFLGSSCEGGMSRALLHLVDYPDYCRELHARYVAHLGETTRMIVERTGVESVFLNSGYSQVPVVSPDLFRSWDLPVIRAVAEAAHRRSVPLHFHNHGRIRPILGALEEGGVDIVCGLFAPPTGDVGGIAELRAACGLALKGMLDPFGALLNGTPEDVERESRECIEGAGPDGGFILGTQDGTLAGTPAANIRAMVEAGRRFGRYR